MFIVWSAGECDGEMEVVEQSDESVVALRVRREADGVVVVLVADDIDVRPTTSQFVMFDVIAANCSVSTDNPSTSSPAAAAAAAVVRTQV